MKLFDARGKFAAPRTVRLDPGAESERAAKYPWIHLGVTSDFNPETMKHGNIITVINRHGKFVAYIINELLRVSFTGEAVLEVREAKGRWAPTGKIELYEPKPFKSPHCCPNNCPGGEMVKAQDFDNKPWHWCPKCLDMYEEHCEQGLHLPHAMFSGCSAMCDM